MKRKKLIRLSITLIVVLALVWSILLYKIFVVKNQSDFYGNLYQHPAPDFELTDHKGSKTFLTQYKGKVILLFFGYTHCPDVCPMTLTNLNKVMDYLGDRKDKVQVIFITIDPERDTQKILKGYIPYYNPDFVGLTGTPDQIDKVADDYNAFYMKEETDSAAGYLMGHTSAVYLIAPNGKLLLRYTQNRMNPEKIAEDIKNIL